ncbi:50S ribosomal protein L13 [Halocalculus aciditolerans]|uniref:50S ribosomal protein L13 n=1 Tax=Halocalculus aciditolerans TaxID=1383812 RepID=A0A830FH55_9EURY|nr:50S ribosomal protein L13 [Halocalculus aciditolerans]GGL55515.1 50S ribosomal protein L13 [Halocalculus aciditolerans]
MSLAEFDADIVVDAGDCIMGRVASNVAELAQQGNTVAVVNAENAVITGNKEDIFGTYRKRAELGSDSGPYYPKRPDGIVKRAIRGMLSYKETDGREAFENIRVFVGNHTDEDGEVLDGTSLDRLSHIKFVQVGEISEHLGANKTW